MTNFSNISHINKVRQFHVNVKYVMCSSLCLFWLNNQFSLSKTNKISCDFNQIGRGQLFQTNEIFNQFSHNTISS
jgi:hypothetical protein